MAGCARLSRRDRIAEPERAHAAAVFDGRFATRSGARRTLAAQGEVFITQGFIARESQGRTVLLGRGGSDTSAAYFGALLKAQRVEIWTDVAGMFSANPRQVRARACCSGWITKRRRKSPPPAPRCCIRAACRRCASRACRC
jgi:aspartokinase